jgi:hypothetical protein
MRILHGRRRFALAIVITAALAGLAVGLVFASDKSGNAGAQGPPRVLAKGEFRSITWTTQGTASLVREPNGDLRLRLSGSFMTKDAPELYVYLAKLRGQQRVYWQEVGTLKNPQGAQEYAVSSEAASSPGLQVAIFCAKCNKISGLAPLSAMTRQS